MTSDEMIDLRERVVRLETKVEEMSKRLDSVSKYCENCTTTYKKGKAAHLSRIQSLKDRTTVNPTELVRALETLTS